MNTIAPSTQPARRLRRWALLTVGLAMSWSAVACGAGATHPGRHSTAVAPPQPNTRQPVTAQHPRVVPVVPRTTQPAAGAPVHVNLFESDGRTYGVGMPIVMRFTRAVTDARPFEQAVTVQVNGVPAAGAWYWERSGAAGYAVEAHYRMRGFWPAHSRISVDAPLSGISAGSGLRYDDSLTLAIDIGAAHVSTVDTSGTHSQLTVTSDGKLVKTLAASLGAAATPTYRGTKVVMEFDRVQQMGDASVPWSLRLTNSGEFAHSASWNGQIGQANTSHGCTNLSVADAQWLFEFSLLGDVVNYPNAPGPVVQVWDGLGDWNLSWSAWRAGGLLPPR